MGIELPRGGSINWNNDALGTAILEILFRKVPPGKTYEAACSTVLPEAPLLLPTIFSWLGRKVQSSEAAGLTSVTRSP
jgi:hypothetical protein